MYAPCSVDIIIGTVLNLLIQWFKTVSSYLLLSGVIKMKKIESKLEENNKITTLLYKSLSESSGASNN